MIETISGKNVKSHFQNEKKAVNRNLWFEQANFIFGLTEQNNYNFVFEMCWVLLSARKIRNSNGCQSPNESKARSERTNNWRKNAYALINWKIATKSCKVIKMYWRYKHFLTAHKNETVLNSCSPSTFKMHFRLTIELQTIESSATIRLSADSSACVVIAVASMSIADAAKNGETYINCRNPSTIFISFRLGKCEKSQPVLVCVQVSIVKVWIFQHLILLLISTANASLNRKNEKNSDLFSVILKAKVFTKWKCGNIFS